MHTYAVDVIIFLNVVFHGVEFMRIMIYFIIKGDKKNIKLYYLSWILSDELLLSSL